MSKDGYEGIEIINSHVKESRKGKLQMYDSLHCKQSKQRTMNLYEKNVKIIQEMSFECKL